MRNYRQRRKHMRIAGMPALLAAIVLTINCCHGASYICAPASGFAAQAPVSTRVSGDLPERAPAPCHAPDAAKAPPHSDPGASDSNDTAHGECFGCEAFVALPDAQPLRIDLAGAAYHIDFATAIDSNQHRPSIPNAAIRPPPRVGPALPGGTQPLYVLIQSFLI